MPMTDYPIHLNIQGRLCTVVGGGTVGLRKVSGLLDAGARVRLVCPNTATTPPAETQWERREYREGDLSGSFLAFAATNRPEVNARVALEAAKEGILLCRVDNPGAGDFGLPALLRRGKLCISVSTSGASPALSATLRDHLAALMGPEWAKVVEIASALRQCRLTPGKPGEYNQRVFHRLIDSGLAAHIAAGDPAAVDRLLAECCGEGASLGALGIHLNEGNS